jgi:ketosteroid isomerase-like protein
MTADRKLVEDAYAAFNARDIDAALATMAFDVVWPNGMEGGSVYGRAGVREYWLRQWTLIDPCVEPVRFETGESGDLLVEVHQVVRNLAGEVLKDQMVIHAYRIEDGRIRSMEIRKA